MTRIYERINLLAITGLVAVVISMLPLSAHGADVEVGFDRADVWAVGAPRRGDEDCSGNGYCNYQSAGRHQIHGWRENEASRI